MKQDIKAELGEIIGEDTMDKLNQLEADAKLAEDLKDQVGEKFTEGKDFLNAFQDVKQEIPIEAIAAR